MHRDARFCGLGTLLLLATATPRCRAFALHAPTFLPGVLSSPPAAASLAVAQPRTVAAAWRGGVLALGMKRKNGAGGNQQRGFPGGRGGGAPGMDDEYLEGKADQKYAYVQGGFAEVEAPKQGNNASMCVLQNSHSACCSRASTLQHGRM